MDIQTGDFLYHSEYKTGQVISVSHDQPAVVEIQFCNRPLERLTLRLLEQSSSKISPQGLRAFAYQDREAADKLFIEDSVKVIILTLNDFDRFCAKTEAIKDYLVPDFIKLANWDAWWEATQPLLKDDPRIDTAKSRIREYRLAQEHQSRAEDDYGYFRSLRHRSSPERLAETARSALKHQREGQALSPEKAEELRKYLNDIIFLDRYPVSLRLETLIRMQEDELVSPEEYQGRLDRLLSQDLRLYDLEMFAARQVIEELRRGDLDKRKRKILATGICAEEAICKQTVSWAIQKHDTDFIAQMLVTAFTENLVATGRPTFYQRLKFRFETCISLVSCLLDTHPAWPEIYQSLGEITKSLVAGKPEETGLVMPAFVRLAAELERRAASIKPELAAVLLDSLAGPQLPLQFVLTMIDVCNKDSGAQQLAKKLKDYLWSHAEQHGDDLLSPLLGKIDDAPVERAVQIVTLIKQYPYQGLINQAGIILCDYCQKVTPQEVLQFVSFLNYFHNTPGNFGWRTRLEALREKAYLAMFQDMQGAFGTKDTAIVQAAQRFSQLEQANLHIEIGNLKSTISELQANVEKLQLQAEDYELKIRELSSIQGGNTEEARFDERVRILRSLAETSAEFEAFAANQPGEHRELVALIRGVFNILAKNRVRLMEEIGSQVEFTSAKHRLADSSVPEKGEKVTVVERGFLILDSNDKLRLLKPALVKK